MRRGRRYIRGSSSCWNAPRSSYQRDDVMPEQKQKRALRQPAQVESQCLCGAVRFEIDTPARWAWHDHTRASRMAHGAAYATYVGSWRKRFLLNAGEEQDTR